MTQTPQGHALPWWGIGRRVWFFWHEPHWYLRMQGRRDGRKGIPKVPVTGGQTATTPQLEALRSAAEHDFHVERTRRDAALLVLAERRQELEREIDLNRHRLQDLETADEERSAFYDQNLERRRLGERSLDPEVIRRRRRRELDTEADERRRRQEAVRGKLDEVQAELGALPDGIATIRANYQDRCGAIDRRCAELMAIYWRSVVRAHPEGTRLNPHWGPLRPPLDGWRQREGAGL